ncbi:MAG: cytochrome-c peroxidase [Flavobacteriaceae bacterium]|nr:cytochrome-c peroxidase [Flavobacteriaceae bacterium]MDH3795689.1 cytochrome-c peroxidase [Flavobacteriaceae bacterium]
MRTLFSRGSVLLSCLIFLSCVDDELVTHPTVSYEQSFKEMVSDLLGTPETLILPGEQDVSKIPADFRNEITPDKIILGKFLFHETGLALNPKNDLGTGTYSCSSCHIAESGFQSGLQQGMADGGLGFGFKGESRIMNPAYQPDSVDVQPIRVPTILNAAFQQVVLWNGQFGANGLNSGTEAQWTEGTPKATNYLGFDGLETQAIAGLSVHRMAVDTSMINNSPYKQLFDRAFPDSPESDRYTQLNAGLSIAAFVRTVLANEAPFQKMLRGEQNTMTEEEFKGAFLFYGKAKCYQCHSGPGMNGMDFHALGMNDLSGNQVIGQVDEATKKGRGGFTNNSADDFKFKTPPLYNLRDVSFFGHGGSFKSVREVIKYKNAARAQNPEVPTNKLSPLFTPLKLSDKEIDQLTLFLENALHDPNLNRYVPEATPLGNCFPNADEQSKIDLGCD